MKPELIIQILTTIIILLVGWAVKQMKDENKKSNDSLEKRFDEYEKEFSIFKETFVQFQIRLEVIQEHCRWQHNVSNYNSNKKVS